MHQANYIIIQSISNFQSTEEKEDYFFKLSLTRDRLGISGFGSCIKQLQLETIGTEQSEKGKDRGQYTASKHCSSSGLSLDT